MLKKIPIALCLSILASWFVAGVAADRLRAEEPYKRFLEKLRDEHLFELALVYLDDLASDRGLRPDFKSALELERGLLTFQAAALLSSSSPEQAGKLDEAEAYLRKFLATQKDHPRRSESRLKLGELLLTRAEQAKTQAGETDEDIPAAIAFYNEAYELFEETLTELKGLLDPSRWSRVDPADKNKAAVRQEIQQDLRRAQLLSAKAIEERGRSRGSDNPQRKADLETSLAMFSDLYTKERRMVGIRNYAMFYRSNLQRDLGKPDDAIDGYQRIADLENVDVLRPLQSSAITELMKLLAAQAKFPVAVERGDRWLSNLRPDERETPETLSLKLELAKIRIAWSERLLKADPEDRAAGRLVRTARDNLRDMLRIPGTHMDATRELLLQLGVENVNRKDTELPQVKDFAEALAAASERLSRSETEAIGLESLTQQLQAAETSADQRKDLEQQLESVRAQIDTDQAQAVQLLHQALRLFGGDDDRAQLYDARFKLAFLHLKQQQPWEAIAIADLLARKDPGTGQGLRAAAIALGGFSDLLRTATTQQQQQLAELLEPLAEYLAATWPESNEAAAATGAIIQLALVNNEWEKAEALLSSIPAESESTAKLRGVVGTAFFAMYLADKQAGNADAAEQLKEKATRQLRAARQFVTAENADTAAIDWANALARLLLEDGQTQAAAQVLLDGDAAPIALLEKQPDRVETIVALKSYHLAIQIAATLMAEEQLTSDETTQRMREYIDAMQRIAASDPEGSKTLTSAFVGLARDLKSQLADTKNPSQRKRLSEVLTLVAGQAANSDAFNVQYWAAETIISIAEEMGNDQASRLAAANAYTEADKILEAILDREKKNPGWIQPPGLETSIRLLLARGRRGVGDYAAAITAIAAILKKNPMLLDVQIEAARTLEAWGKLKPEFYRTAYLGGPAGNKLFWGWGRIAQETLGKEQFTEQFFEARFHLATNRYRYAQSTNDQAEMARAEKDITSTAALYPELGGPESKKRFDGLLAVIQKALGK